MIWAARVRLSWDRSAGLREIACRDLRRPGRRRGLYRGFAAGAQRPRLAHAARGSASLVGTLIADEDGVYGTRHPNDRLLLGMKGTMSEMELVAVSAELARSPQAESAPWRIGDHRRHRLRQGARTTG